MEEILKSVEYENCIIRVIKSEKIPLVRIMVYSPLLEFSLGLFDRKSTDLSDVALKKIVEDKHSMITKLSGNDLNRIKWLSETAFSTVIDDGISICIKNRFGKREIYDCDKSKFDIININEIEGNTIDDIHTIYYGKNMWIQL